MNTAFAPFAEMKRARQFFESRGYYVESVNYSELDGITVDVINPHIAALDACLDQLPIQFKNRELFG